MAWRLAKILETKLGLKKKVFRVLGWRMGEINMAKCPSFYYNISKEIFKVDESESDEN